MDIIIYVLTIIGIYFVALISYSKLTNTDLTTANAEFKKEIASLMKKIYQECRKDSRCSNANPMYCLTNWEADNFVTQLFKYCESAIVVSVSNNNQFCYLKYQITGIKEKLLENQLIAKRALELDLQRYFKQLRQVDSPPAVLCTSFIEGQLTFQIALSFDAASIIQQKALTRKGGIKK